MADTPFDIGHLYQGEQDRIRDGQLTRDERDKLMRGENPWPKPEPKTPPRIKPLVEIFNEHEKVQREAERKLHKLIYGEHADSPPPAPQEPVKTEIDAVPDTPETPPKKPWSASNYKSRKAEREREEANSPPEDKAPPPLEWSPEFKRTWIAERQTASNASQQATNPKPPWEPDKDRWSPAALKWLEQQRHAGRTFKDAAEADAAYRASQRPEFPVPQGETLGKILERALGTNEAEARYLLSQSRKNARSPVAPALVSHRISRVLAGGLFALFFGALIQALTLFGVITMNSGHIFMAVAFAAGALLLITEVLPVKPRKHKILSVVILGVVLLVIDIASALYASHQTQKVQGIQPPERRGGYVQVFDRQLMPLINQQTQARSGAVNVQYQAKGDATVVGIVHRHMLYVAANELSKEEIGRLLEPLRDVKYQEENEVYELQPDSPIQLTTSPSDDDDIRNFNQDFTQILSGKEILYSIIIFKYRDKGMPTGMIRITENCGWIKGDPKNAAWHNCWNRVYDAPLR